MTIRTEPEVPDEFPPARLFLDDIEEITGILVESTEMPAKSTVKLSIKDQVCDEVQELPKIARKTSDLSISVTSCGDEFSSSTLRIGHTIFLSFVGFTREQELNIFHRLAPIFKRRNLYWRTYVHSNSSAFIMSMVFCCLAYILIFFMPKDERTRALGILIPANALVIVAWAFGGIAHSTVIMRPSYESSPVREGLRDKLPAALIGAGVGCVLTFLLGLLGLYLKRKYWP